MAKLEDYTQIEQAETVIDLELGEEFIKDLLDWEEAPPAWAEMALAYSRLAFTLGYQLRMVEGRDGRIKSGRTFKKAIENLGARFK